MRASTEEEIPDPSDSPANTILHGHAVGWPVSRLIISKVTFRESSAFFDVKTWGLSYREWLQGYGSTKREVDHVSVRSQIQGPVFRKHMEVCKTMLGADSPAKDNFSVETRTHL